MVVILVTLTFTTVRADWKQALTIIANMLIYHTTQQCVGLADCTFWAGVGLSRGGRGVTGAMSLGLQLKTSLLRNFTKLHNYIKHS